MTEHNDWWNDAADRIAQGSFPALLRPFWWLWRTYNWLRPESIFMRLGLMGLSLFTFDVALNSGLGTPTLLAELATGAAFFCLACGRRKVEIVKRASVKPARLHAVPELGVSAPRGRRGWPLWQLALISVLAGVITVVVSHAFHV